MNCAWCGDASGVDKLCSVCRPVHDHPLYHCTVDASHTPTLGPSCATCDHRTAQIAYRDRMNAPLIASLHKMRANLIRDWHKPWPGLEFAKGLFGQSIDKSLKDLGARNTGQYQHVNALD